MQLPADMPPQPQPAVHRRATVAEVREAARGHWRRVCLALSPSLQDAITAGPSRHVDCPVHGGEHGDAFRIFEDFDETGGTVCNTCGSAADGIDTLIFANGWKFDDAVERVAEFLGVQGTATKRRGRPKKSTVAAASSASTAGPAPSVNGHTKPTADPSANTAEVAKARAKILARWQQATPDTGRIAAYLAHRGLSVAVPPTLKLSRQTYYDAEGAAVGEFPCMLGLFTSEHGIVSLHRTYLSPTDPGKADVPTPKKWTAPVSPRATSGAAIRLYMPGAEDTTLAITEGIETALAVHQATLLPVWAAGSASNLAAVEIPAPGRRSKIRRVELWIDPGTAGEEAGEKAAGRLTAEGFEVVVVCPKLAGAGDWLDVLIAGGAETLRAAQAEAVPYEANKPARRLNLISSAEFAGGDYKLEFLIKNMLIRGQPVVVGGLKKTLKTTLMVDLALSLGTGTMFLQNFEVPNKANVAIFSGESGPATLQETAIRIAKHRGITLGQASVWWSFDLPQIGREADLDEVADLIDEHKCEVAIIDPAYLAMLAGIPGKSAANIFDMGSILLGLTQLGRDTDCTMILCHHLRKNGPNDQFSPPELEDLSFSGFAEWARQWLLIGRRQRYEQGTGSHALWLSTGGSAGHGGLWAVDIEEGVQDEWLGGRSWSVGIRSANQAIEQAQKSRQSDKEEKDIQRLLEVFLRYPNGETKNIIRDASGMSGNTFNRILVLLIAENMVEECDVKKKRGKGFVDVSGYKITEGGQRRTQADKGGQSACGGRRTDKTPIRGVLSAFPCPDSGLQNTGESNDESVRVQEPKLFTPDWQTPDQNFSEF